MRVERNFVPVGRNTFTLRSVAPDETGILDFCAGHLESRWGSNVRDELAQVNFLVAIFHPDDEFPAGWGSINPYGSPDGEESGQDYFDHLFVRAEFQGKGLVEYIYGMQLEYARTHGNLLILRVPILESVKKFSEKRGWRCRRDLPKHREEYPFGVWELPRSRLPDYSFY